MSHTLNDLSREELVNRPVSWGYHCTAEMPWVCPLHAERKELVAISKPHTTPSWSLAHCSCVDATTGQVKGNVLIGLSRSWTPIAPSISPLPDKRLPQCVCVICALCTCVCACACESTCNT